MFSPRRLIVPLLCAAAFAAFAAAPASAYIYWSAGSTTIFRAGNDGSAFGTFVQTPPFSSAVAIDGTYVYWGTSDGRIGRANLDGSNPNPNFITGLPGPSGLSGLAVNATNIFWANYADIGRANIDGTGADPTFIAAADHPVGLAINATHLYWGENSIGKIGKATVGGRQIEKDFVAAPGDPCSVTVDDTYVYWADATGNRIGRATLAGAGGDPNFIDPGKLVSCSVAAYGPFLYFGLSDAVFGPTSIGRSALNGSNLQTNFIGLTPYGAPTAQIVVDSLGPASPLPANSFKVGKLKRNPKKGTARLRITLPGPGTLVLIAKKVKKQIKTVAGPKTVWMPIRPKPALAKKLRRTHKALVSVKLRYTPTNGLSKKKVKRVRLVRRGR